MTLGIKAGSTGRSGTALEKINTENVREYADIEGYWEDFYQMFGFHMDGVDYEKDLDPSVNIPSIPDAE